MRRTKFLKVFYDFIRNTMSYDSEPYEDYPLSPMETQEPIEAQEEIDEDEADLAETISRYCMRIP